MRETALKTAIIIGATGLTGGILLRLLLKDERYGKIKLFSRSSVGIDHDKLEETLGDLFQFEYFKDRFLADEVFCCIGTTKAKTPNKDMYRKIDYEIPKCAAQLCKENGIKSFVVISALGANANSNIFYNRTKGEMEDAVFQYKISNTYILRPSLIAGNRKERRTGEMVFKQLMEVANLVMVGPLRKYRSIQAETIAKAMVWLANNSYPATRIPSNEIIEIAHRTKLL